MKSLLAYIRPSDMSFEIYTDKIGESGRSIIRQAYEEARSLEHKLLTPEHVLIAYAKTERAAFDSLMKRLNLESQAVLEAVSARISERYPAAEAMKISDTFRAMLTNALKHARENGRSRIEATDILTGLFADARDFPATLFEQLGVDCQTVNKQIRDLDVSR